MRADRPPHLRVLHDRAGRDEEVDVIGERLPAAERVGHTAARKALGEDLGAGAVQARVASVQEGRVGRDGEQQRQHRTQPVAHQHGAVGAADADVDVQRERVVAPRHVLQPLLDPVVVLGVDDVLLAVVRPRMGPGGAERDVMFGGQREQAPPPFALGGERRRRDPDIDPSGSRSRRRSAPRPPNPPAPDRPRRRRAAPRTAAPGPASSRSRSANSSSSPTVKSVELSKASNAASRSRLLLTRAGGWYLIRDQVRRIR